ncbi:hypothetical protein VNO78_03261 [Psophocarpus tetragonolobus]|uniref:Small auxin up regulated protein n=1 Tax=Psophocarpus tetragonolobus TaxID=3891 RepID=A0AAN9T1W5_PSOTE
MWVSRASTGRKTFFEAAWLFLISLIANALFFFRQNRAVLQNVKSFAVFLLALQNSKLFGSRGGSKLTGIRQIVRLKEMLQKWQNVTLGSKSSNPSSNDPVNNDDRGISPLINKRIIDVMHCESDNEDSCQSPEPLPPPDVPKGYLAVYVGPELRRFIIPTSYLSHSLFKVLLEKAADEFGFDQSGGLTIPCEIETFKYLVKCMENEKKEQLSDSAPGSSGTVEE